VTRRAFWSRAVSGVYVVLLAGACATAPSVTPEQRTRINAAAQVCQREHPTVERYEVNHFGIVTAFYRYGPGQVSATDPFFDCVRAKLGGAVPTTAPVLPAVAAPQTPTKAIVPASSPGRWPIALPLPDDVTVRPPPPYVVPALQPLSGRWAGTADQGRFAVGLVVEELRPPITVVILSFLSDGLGQTRRREAQIQSDTLTLVVEGVSAGSTVQYRLQPDGTLLMRLEDGTGQLITMTLRRVP
jgi:hypothetical protein